MARSAPTFPVESVSDECMERLFDFVLHYEYELTQERNANGRLTSHGKAQLALVRRMLVDLGLDWDVAHDAKPWMSTRETV